MARTPGKGYSVMQEGVCREVICFKGQVTERTRKWVFFIFKSVLVCSHPSSPSQEMSCTYTLSTNQLTEQ